MKPYVSLVGRDWIVIDRYGEDAFVTRERHAAFNFLREHWGELNAKR